MERRVTVGAEARGSVLDDLQLLRDQSTFPVEVGAPEMAVVEPAEARDGAIEFEVQEQLGDGWHLPQLELSSWYGAELGPRAVATVDIQTSKEAVYVEVVRILQRLYGMV